MADAYASGAVLDAALPGERLRAGGAAEITAVLARVFAGPGRLIEWDAAVHPEGAAIWLERVGEDGRAVRERHYLHTDGAGHVARHWLYAARPRTAPASDPVPEAAEELFASLGEVAERTTLASSGWSGNRIDRLVLADGRALIAKRIVPGSDWRGGAPPSLGANWRAALDSGMLDAVRAGRLDEARGLLRAALHPAVPPASDPLS